MRHIDRSFGQIMIELIKDPREHVKKLAFLASHSAQALIPSPYLLAEQGNLCNFFLHINIIMFLKPANSDTENGIKKSKKSPEKNHVQRKLEN